MKKKSERTAENNPAAMKTNENTIAYIQNITIKFPVIL